MGRIREAIQVRGRDCWTMFDSGARDSYIVPAIAALVPTSQLDQSFRSRLGGSIKESKQAAHLDALVEGRCMSFHAMVVDSIGADEDGFIEILFGALAMKQWGVRLVPEQEKLDLTHYPEEFLEF